MIIICKDCGKIDNTYAVSTPQVIPTTSWPMDWATLGYCPECLEEYEVKCVNCNTAFYKLDKKDMILQAADFICKTCKNIKW